MGVVAAIIGAVATVASVGEGIYSATAPKPKAPDNLAAEEAKAAQAAAQAQATALQKRRGMASTIMTSPMGAPQAPTQRTTLGT